MMGYAVSYHSDLEATLSVSYSFNEIPQCLYPQPHLPLPNPIPSQVEIMYPLPDS